MQTRIRLHLGIATAFALAMIPMFGAIVGYLYYNNTRLALDVAAGDMDQSSQDISESIGNLLVPVARVADAMAAMARTDYSSLRRVEGLRVFHRQIDKLPQVYSFYMGFETDGSFYQVVHLPENLTRFGPHQQPPPPGSRFALRLLDSSSGAKADSYIYFAEWGEITGVDRGPSSYDPRQRPWYKVTEDKADVVTSDVYTFASTQRPGLTVSRRVTSESGVTIGVVGGDITLDALSAFLDRKKIGGQGRIVLIDGQGRVIGQSGHSESLAKGELVSAERADDPVVAAAVAKRQGGAGDRFTLEMPDGKRFMTIFLPFAPSAGSPWLIGVLADEDTFTGPIRAATLRTVGVGAVVLVLALLAIQFLSRQLTRPLSLIAEEAARIRDFNLGSQFALSSRIVEVADLAATIISMKTSLRNFSVYVPRELVRSIVALGREVSIGGERRPLTIMFSDIAGFTSRSEPLPPEDVLRELSLYFQAVSGAIQSNKGTIDKFIGDAVMALWNAPAPDPDHAANACRALLACQAACRKLNAENQDGKLLPLVTRFGLHSGEVMVGNAGASDRMQYTVLGPAVNLASRIEGLNKVYGTELLVSDAVVAQAGGGFLFRAVDLVSPAGTTQATAIYELMAERGPDTDPALLARHADWAAAHDLYGQRRWAEAAAAFDAYLARHGEEKLARLYAERCHGFVTDPPPAGWNGVRAFDKK
jgi:adenylate cyclase